MVVLSIFSENIIYQEFFENLYVCMHHGPVLFVNGTGDDGTTCVFSKGCCEVNGTVVKDGFGGLTHLRKYDFLNIVKTNIPLRFKENMINFYYSIR